jgi:hypothetical protein
MSANLLGAALVALWVAAWTIATLYAGHKARAAGLATTENVTGGTIA